MLSVPGIYKNGNVILLEEIPQVQQARVIVTVLEEWPVLLSQNQVEQANHWLGALAHTATIVGDIVQPLDETMITIQRSFASSLGTLRNQQEILYTDFMDEHG